MWPKHNSGSTQLTAIIPRPAQQRGRAEGLIYQRRRSSVISIILQIRGMLQGVSTKNSILWYTKSVRGTNVWMEVAV